MNCSVSIHCVYVIMYYMLYISHLKVCIIIPRKGLAVKKFLNIIYVMQKFCKLVSTAYGTDGLCKNPRDIHV